MGAKTSVLVASSGDCRAALSEARESNLQLTERLVRSLFLRHSVELLEDSGSLGEIHPQPGVCSAAVFPSVTVVASMLSTLDRPSLLAAEVREALGLPRVVLHAMHSVVDWLAFAVWEEGRLTRAFSLSPDDGIIENIGEPLAVEVPFWAGEHPVGDGYPLAFHPLELGEELLADQFGFILEGFALPGLFDPFDKPLWVFTVDDDRPASPPGPDQRSALDGHGPSPRRRSWGFWRH